MTYFQSARFISIVDGRGSARNHLGDEMPICAHSDDRDHLFRSIDQGGARR
jgi:hypothetical protein